MQPPNLQHNASTTYVTVCLDAIGVHLPTLHKFGFENFPPFILLR
jgi:hypothetical protein